MSWIPLYSVATRNLDSDAPILREIFDSLRSMIVHDTTSYRFDNDAEFAMGWWFFTIHVEEDFIKRLVTHLHRQNSKIKDEGTILEIIQVHLKSKDSTAVIKQQGGRSIFARYWSWLMR